MLVRISRFLLILLVIIIAAIYLPYFYWMSFEEYIKTPFIRYSPVIKKFIILRSADKTTRWFDSDGKKYMLEETDPLLPFFNYRQLTSRGIMPDSVQDIKIDLKELRINNFYRRIRPSDIDRPQIPLYPLFESKPKRVNLEFPDEFFRITDRMEFIVTETNKIQPDITESFTKALREKDFNFPAKLISGNPTTRKPFDEGYFIIDSGHKLFHIKKVDGKPYCVNTNIPPDIKTRAIFINEHSLREFYGLLISEDDQLYLITYDNYRLQHLPVEGYVSSKNTIMFQGNLLYRMISIISENKIKVFVTNRKYELVDTYEESWKGKYERTAGIASKYIFPFTINLHSSKSKYVDFYVRAFSYTSIYLNLFFLILTVLLMKYRKNRIIQKWYNLLIVLITGIYGFIAIAIFESTDT